METADLPRELADKQSAARGSCDLAARRSRERSLLGRLRPRSIGRMSGGTGGGGRSVLSVTPLPPTRARRRFCIGPLQTTSGFYGEMWHFARARSPARHGGPLFT